MATRFRTAFLCCAAVSPSVWTVARLEQSLVVSVALSTTHSLSVTHFISLSATSLSPKFSSWSWVIRSSTSVVSHSFCVIYSSAFCVVILRTLTVPCQVLVHEQDVDTYLQLFPCRLSSEWLFFSSNSCHDRTFDFARFAPKFDCAVKNM
jgi:hypothetical protein